MNLLEELQTVLKQDDRFVSESGELLKASISSAAMRMDLELVSLLLDNPLLKESFFSEVGAVTVFDKSKFDWVVNSKEFLPDSYTVYKNKVGLSTNDKDLHMESSNVTLVWPYKDTILEGGQTAEDQQLNEVFYNETLAPDQVRKLLAPKAFTNGRRYTESGEEEVGEITDQDNLIIKGNNMLGLSSLLEKYRGKVKMIYIDPPYYFGKQKDSDTFSYNSNFKLSTWLTFMKNRLEIARELLSNDGAIFVSIGNEGQAYLKILMDEVFGVNNFVETFIWKNTDNANALGVKSRSGIESIHAYERSFQSKKKWLGKLSENDDAPLLNSSNGEGTLLFKAGTIHFRIPDGKYEIGRKPKLELLDDLIVKDGKNENDVRMKGKFKWGQENLEHEVRKGTYFLIKTNQFSIRYQKFEGSYVAPEKLIDHSYLEKVIGVGTYEDSNTHMENLGINFTYSKPESLIAFFIRAVTQEEDLVLDFFLGAGTTAAVAHKMNRRYIGIEQMEETIQNATIPRMRKVIQGEEGGISRDMQWEQGGSFVYLEMKEMNEAFIRKLEETTETSEIISIYFEAKEKGWLIPSIETEKFENLEFFEALSLEEQKNAVLLSLDKNKLYVNASDIDDTELGLTDQEKELTSNFYRKEVESIVEHRTLPV